MASARERLHSNSGEQEKQLPSLSWEAILKDLGLVLTLTYATGFLVVFTFLAGFGITDFVGELFKLKYFYVGILCVSFPAFIALPLILKWRAVRPESFFDDPDTNPFAHELKKNRQRHIYEIPALFIILNMVTMIYIIIALFSVETYRERQGRIVILLVGSMVSIWLVKRIFPVKVRASNILGIGGTKNASRIPLFLARSVALLIFIGWDIITCYGLDIFHVLTKGIYYALLMLATVWRLVRLDTYIRYEEPIDSARTMAQASIVLALYIVSCFSFTTTIYKHIAATFGGGDYEREPNKVICLSSAVAPAEIMASGACTLPLKVLHETEAMVYVAPSFALPNGIYTSNSPQPARERAIEWQSWNNIPRTYGIAVKSISSETDADGQIIERSIAQPPVTVYSIPLVNNEPPAKGGVGGK